MIFVWLFFVINVRAGQIHIKMWKWYYYKIFIHIFMPDVYLYNISVPYYNYITVFFYVEDKNVHKCGELYVKFIVFKCNCSLYLNAQMLIINA